VPGRQPGPPRGLDGGIPPALGGPSGGHNPKHGKKNKGKRKKGPPPPRTGQWNRVKADGRREKRAGPAGHVWKASSKGGRGPRQTQPRNPKKRSEHKKKKFEVPSAAHKQRGRQPGKGRGGKGKKGEEKKGRKRGEKGERRKERRKKTTSPPGGKKTEKKHRFLAPPKGVGKGRKLKKAGTARIGENLGHPLGARGRTGGKTKVKKKTGRAQKKN